MDKALIASTQMSPTVSVVLPVYNGAKYLGEAIESVLTQTHTAFELIIIDDGSTDDSASVIARYQDSRIRSYAHANRGLAATLNRGIELAEGRYVARQDQDDVSSPGRFSHQVSYLDRNADCALVGTWAEIWSEGRPTGRFHEHPADSPSLKFALLLNNPFVHSSVMVRKAALEQVGPYCVDRNRQPPEDFELWSRIARVFEVANIPKVLHRYREVAGSMSREGLSPFLDHLVTISAENIAWASDEPSESPHVLNIAALAHGVPGRVVGTPDFAFMGKIFRRAAERVVPNVVQQRFVLEAERRIGALERSFLEQRAPSTLARRLVRFARHKLHCLIKAS